MEISNIFKQAISNTFYDKDIEIYATETIEDNEGAITGKEKTELIDKFKGNFQFKTREKIQEQYGQEIEANAIVTCIETSAKIGDILVYNNNDYEIKGIIPSDSHSTIIINGSDNNE